MPHPDLRKNHKTGATLSAFAHPTGILTLVLIVGWIDYITGYEVSVFPLYGLPIALSVWYFGFAGGVIGCGLCALAWVLADYFTGHTYSLEWVRWVNASARLIYFVFVTITFLYLRRTVTESDQRLRTISTLLPVCMQCHKVVDADGHWVSMQEFIADQTHAHFRPKICPDCARHDYRHR